MIARPLLLAALLSIGGCVAAGPPEYDAPAVSCQEDEPCWDCDTMGNQICGPTAVAEDGSIVSANYWDAD